MTSHSSISNQYVYFTICEEQASDENTGDYGVVLASQLLSSLYRDNCDVFQGEGKDMARRHIARGARLPVKSLDQNTFFFQGCPVLFTEGLARIFGDSAEIKVQATDNQLTDLHNAVNPRAKKAEFELTVKGSVRDLLLRHNLL